MNNKEFRIGNYVSDGFLTDAKGKKHLIEYQLTDGRDIDALAFNGKKPIPLTEEMLVRLGFSFYESYGGGYELNGIRLDRVYSANSLDGKMFVFYISGTRLTTCVIVKYVHQLQNIYLDLIGEELQLNNIHP